MKIEKYLQESPLFAISSLYESIVTQVNADLKKEKVNLLQGLILTSLFFEEREVSPSELAKVFATSRGSISHSISHLEAIGCVKRILNPADARSFILELKPEGRKKALNLVKFFDAIQSKFEKIVGVGNLKRTIGDLGNLRQLSGRSLKIPD